jgi:outer membrane protein, heavy metal efflux system
MLAAWPAYAGCRTALPPVEMPTRVAMADDRDASITPVAYRQTEPVIKTPTRLHDDAVLTPEAVIRVVLERNPTLEQMAAAATAAGARYQQVTSLDDPMLSVSAAPGSIGSPNADLATRVELSQKFTRADKREAKGRAALAEASAATQDANDAKVQLVEAARSAFADYYLAEKGAAVAEESLALLKEFRRNAETQYRLGVAPQQDVLQADQELAKVEERLLALRRAKGVAVARLNALTHAPAGSALPPPADVVVGGPLPPAEALRAKAVENRPDLKALAARLAADEAAVDGAAREFKPDVELLAAYDGFWQGANGRPLQWQVGARINLPVRTDRRSGAVAEAAARAAQRRAEYARLLDQVGLQVQEAYELARESTDAAVLYETKLLPAATATVKAAQAAYVNNKVPFLTLIEAQRSLVTLKDRSFEVKADTYRRRAALDRAVGEVGVSRPPEPK